MTFFFLGRKPGRTKIATITPEKNEEDVDDPSAMKKGTYFVVYLAFSPFLFLEFTMLISFSGQKRRRNKPPSSTPVNESCESSSGEEGEFSTQDSDSSETFSDLENECDTSGIGELPGQSSSSFGFIS